LAKALGILRLTWGFTKTRFKRLDKLLLLLCMVASVFGVYLLYSLQQNGINPDVISPRAWIMQAAATGVGVFCALFISLIDYKFISKLWFIYAPIALILSLLLFVPSLNMSTPGSEATTWLDLGFMQIQPSEFLTVAFIMSFATHIYKLGDKLNQLPHVLLLCFHAIVPIGIMAMQGNTGTPLIVILVFLLMLFMAGISWKYMAMALVAVPVIGWAFWNFYAKEYHKLRILVIFDEEIQQQEMRGFFHQQYRSLMAMGSGGITGQGLEGGEYVSIFAIHNDFIFSYIGMTLGLIGCVLTLLLMLSICVKLLSAMSAAKDPLGRAICAGTFATIFFHTVINVGMAVVVTPVVGVQLPFISAGGSSLLSLYIAIGLSLSVWSHRERKYNMFYTEKD
jgi:rod shape determining protein RodA